jgi:hypothetical protein
MNNVRKDYFITFYFLLLSPQPINHWCKFIALQWFAVLCCGPIACDVPAFRDTQQASNKLLHNTAVVCLWFGTDIILRAS